LLLHSPLQLASFVKLLKTIKTLTRENRLVHIYIHISQAESSDVTCCDESSRRPLQRDEESELTPR
jgi:hypothetical protein